MPFTKIVMSQVGLLLIQYLNQMIGQNQVKLDTLMKQDERNPKYQIFVAMATFSV